MKVLNSVKHLLECHCTLKIYEKKDKNLDNHLFHKFPVYSKYDNKTGKFIEKIAQCNNCQTLHRVIDVCKSEIIPGGKDKDMTLTTIEDMELQLPNKLYNFLVGQNTDITAFEHALDIIDNEYWGSQIVIARELIDLKYHIKVLEINGENKFKIIKKIIEDEINLG